MIERTTAIRLRANQIKQLNEEKLKTYLKDDHIFLATKSNLLIADMLEKQISEIETAKRKVKIIKRTATNIYVGPILKQLILPFVIMKL